MEIDDGSILEAWEKNGLQWIEIIKSQLIQSRATTNPAIVSAIKSYKPISLLDLGCGEGWLCREVAKSGIEVTGIDGVGSLIKYARSHSDGTFIKASYEEIIKFQTTVSSKFDLISFNFSLFEKQGVYDILDWTKTCLGKEGVVVIQTIHPDNATIATDESSKWRRETLKNYHDSFAPFHWFFRSTSDWHDCFYKCGLKLIKADDVYIKDNEDPFSIIYHLALA